ncbi:ABC transporter permease [Lacibacter sediminis]|uniref:ABC transporter permease n=1 Tax=Lacibacter sediminis TaxID=2760713 RepID=A0A7G5XD81_9BACT|nr:ABC transporter permease [Lacibacter sediminis]QNA43434.1 ABC transporter permease [Lacibacter sediminis]
MFSNYLKIAWRNLLKNKTFSLINIIGLASGLACFILITLYITDELRYDRYHEKADRIYRINSDIRFGGTALNMAVSADPMGATLKKDYPQVEQFARIYGSEGSKLFKKDNVFITEERVVYADSTLFDVFTFPAVAGNAKTALNEPNTVVISESTAKKYFGSVDAAMGKTMECNDERNRLYKVTAVIKDIPKNSHFIFDMFLSMDNVEYGFGNFLSHNFHTYIVLKPGTDYKAFEKNFVQVIDKYMLPQARQFMQIESMKDFEKTGNRLAYSLIPLTDIHLHSERGVELGVNGSIQYVYIFGAVALFILLIACINFMNLSTARSASRAKEVGIRKVLGTEKKSLIRQFLAESTLTSFIALLLAFAFTWLALNWFNDLAAKDFQITDLLQPGFLLFLLAMPIAVGLVAGSYPAFFLSSFKPIAVLKGKMNAGFSKSNLRSTLVVFQFFTTILLITGTIVIYKQLNYIQSKKIGFNKEQVMVVDIPSMSRSTAESFKTEVSKLSSVKSASFAGFLPVSNSARNDNTWSTESVMTEKNGFNMQNWRIDYDYIPTLGMEIIKGRNFSPQYGGDSTALIINEATAALIGGGDPIGKKLYSSDGQNPLVYTVIGVVKNFNYESLRKNVSPLCFRLGNNRWAAAFRVETKEMKNLLTQVESKFKAMAPGMPFSYNFLDESFDRMYRDEQRIGKIAFSFSFLAILIACLGLFGLATYMAEQRTKEIGIRKVLGASVSGIVQMLSKDFVKLVLIACVFAIPLAWWAMSQWLQNFAYRVSIGWWVFAAAAVIALIIAILTVSSQAVKAALSNPVKSLRTE